MSSTKGSSSPRGAGGVGGGGGGGANNTISHAGRISHSGSQGIPFAPKNNQVVAFSDGVDELREERESESRQPNNKKGGHGHSAGGGGGAGAGAGSPRTTKRRKEKLPEHVRQLHKHGNKKNSLHHHAADRRGQQEIEKRAAYNKEIRKPRKKETLRTQLANVRCVQCV